MMGTGHASLGYFKIQKEYKLAIYTDKKVKDCGSATLTQTVWWTARKPPDQGMLIVTLYNATMRCLHLPNHPAVDGISDH